MNSVSLSDAELALLDGRCRPEVQAKVDDAKARLDEVTRWPDLTPAEAGFIADVRREALASGLLVHHACRVAHCRVCDRSGGYAKHARSSRNHRKGDTDYRRPIDLPGYDLADSFITMSGHPKLGCCAECFNRLRPQLAQALANIRAEVPESITGQPKAWRRSDLCVCSKCNWSGSDLRMGRLPAVFSGYYHGQCPECGAQNGFGRDVIKNTKGFELVPVPVVEREVTP